MQYNLTGKLQKGYIAEAGNILRRMAFEYNPEEFSETLSAEYKEIQSPGMSYPTFSYVGGNSTPITFTLFINGRSPGKQDAEKSIDFVKSFLPGSGNQDFLYSPPTPLLFCFGPYMRRCLLKTMTVNRTMFDRDLKTIQATIDVELIIIS